MHVKLLSPEAFFRPKCSTYRSAAGIVRTRSRSGAYSAALISGLRGHLVGLYHAHLRSCFTKRDKNVA